MGYFRTWKAEFEGSRELKIVDKELDQFEENLITLLDQMGVNLSNGTFNNIVTNNITIGGTTNGPSVGLLLRATRTLNQSQIAALTTTPLELLTPPPNFLGTAPGAGFTINPVRADWTLVTTNAAFGNVSSDAYLAITLGADTTVFGPRTVAAHLIANALAAQGAFTGLFGPTEAMQTSATFENQALYVTLFNAAGALTGGAGASLIVNQYYVISPTSQATATNTIVYTTSVRKVEPPAANRIAVTPSGTAFADSAWFEIDAATSAAWALVAIAFNPAVNDVYVAFDVGVGAAGSETVVASISGYQDTEATCMNHRLAWPIPIGGRIANGARVAVRMRKAGTNTSNWSVALEYFEEPMTGNAVVSPVVPILATSGVSLTPSGTDAAYSGWAHNSAPNTTDHVIGALMVTFIPVYPPYELSIGRGPTGQEVTLFKDRAVAKDISTLGGGGLYTQPCYPALPVIRSGDSLSFRLRKDGTSTATWFLDVLSYPGAAFPLLTTDTQNAYEWYPDTGDTLTALAYSGSSWTNGAYSVLFTTTKDIAVCAVLVNIDTTTAGIEIDLAIGTAGNEVVVARTRVEANGIFSGDVQAVTLVLARNIAAGEIVSARRRSSAAAGCAVAIGYIEDPDFYQRRDTVDVCYPSAANAVGVAGNTTAWLDSAYGELVSATASSVYLTALNFTTALNGVDVEFDLAIGSAASEVVIGTFTTFVGNASGGGNGQIPIIPPLRVATGQRLAYRFRKTGTSATGFSVSAVAIPTA